MKNSMNKTGSITRRSALRTLGAAGALAAATTVATPLAALAATSGSCGTSATWKFDSSTGTLTVSGTGAMADYEYATQPWADLADSITQAVVSSGITYIGAYAFADLAYLASASIASSVTTIGDSAFEFAGDYMCGTSGLTSVTIPEGVTTIGDYAFYHVYGLSSVSLPSTLKTIGKWAFARDSCFSSELTSIDLPYGLTTIGEAAFMYSALESVAIPPTVTELGAGAFEGCSDLVSVTFEGDAPTIVDDDEFCEGWLGFDDDVPYAASVFCGCTTTVTYYTNTSGWTDDYIAAFSADDSDYAVDLTWNSAIGMYRLYNQWSGEHFYTKDTNEYTTLVSLGWTYEHVAWGAPESGSSVYRLYNPYSGDHHFTTDANEYATLAAIGWEQEGVSWLSDDAKGTPVYRLYNPYASAFYHHYTTDANERAELLKLGWEDEGIGWYGL